MEDKYGWTCQYKNIPGDQTYHIVLTGGWTAGNSTWRWVLSPRCSTPTRCPHTPPGGRGSTASRSHTAADPAPGRSSWRRIHPSPARAGEQIPWRDAGCVRRLQSHLLPPLLRLWVCCLDSRCDVSSRTGTNKTVWESGGKKTHVEEEKEEGKQSQTPFLSY